LAHAKAMHEPFPDQNGVAPRGPDPRLVVDAYADQGARDDPEGQARITAFVQGLQQLAWTEGRNLQFEYRWGSGDLQKAAAELVALSSDVIFVCATPAAL
jgi:hypothetical protein